MSVSGIRPGPVPFYQHGPVVGAAIVAKCRELVEGVGVEAETWWHHDSVSLHIRRPLTEAEMAMLPDGWLSCPAVDTGGNEDRMSREPPW